MIPVPTYHPFEGYYPDSEPDVSDDPPPEDDEDIEEN